MKKSVMRYFLLLFAIVFSTFLVAQTAEELRFVDAGSLMITGKGFEVTTEKYGRLPKEMEAELRKELLVLGSNSAGIAVRFNTNSSVIAARWGVVNDLRMNHMASTGIKGLDLYVLEGGRWIYTGTARPAGKETFSLFVKNMTRQFREYIAYLPLYDGTEFLEIGVEPESIIRTPQNQRLIKNENKKPLLFYGTSITQGGCASRPGMAYPAILGRMLDRETINLGFSGNARMDFSMAKVIAKVESEIIVIDCLPNTTAQMVRDSAYTFVTYIAKDRPQTPIFLVENPNFPHLVVNQQAAQEIAEENTVFRELFARLMSEGYTNIIYIRGEGLLGDDNESTVDGVHLTDLGFLRFAYSLYEYISPYLADR